MCFEDFGHKKKCTNVTNVVILLLTFLNSYLKLELGAHNRIWTFSLLDYANASCSPLSSEFIAFQQDSWTFRHSLRFWRETYAWGSGGHRKEPKHFQIFSLWHKFGRHCFFFSFLAFCKNGGPFRRAVGNAEHGRNQRKLWQIHGLLEKQQQKLNSNRLLFDKRGDRFAGFGIARWNASCFSLQTGSSEGHLWTVKPHDADVTGHGQHFFTDTHIFLFFCFFLRMAKNKQQTKKGGDILFPSSSAKVLSTFFALNLKKKKEKQKVPVSLWKQSVFAAVHSLREEFEEVFTAKKKKKTHCTS